MEGNTSYSRVRKSLSHCAAILTATETQLKTRWRWFRCFSMAAVRLDKLRKEAPPWFDGVRTWTTVSQISLCNVRYTAGNSPLALWTVRIRLCRSANSRKTLVHQISRKDRNCVKSNFIRTIFNFASYKNIAPLEAVCELL